MEGPRKEEWDLEQGVRDEEEMGLGWGKTGVQVQKGSSLGGWAAESFQLEHTLCSRAWNGNQDY